MARPLRIEFAGALYHITARGNERRDIFFEDKDREAFVSSGVRVTQRRQGQILLYACYVSQLAKACAIVILGVGHMSSGAVLSPEAVPYSGEPG